MLRVAVVLVCLVSVAGAAQKSEKTDGGSKTGQKSKSKSKSKKAKEEKRIDIEGLVTAAPLPKDYEIKRQDIENEGKVLGYKLLLTNDDALSKAIVSIENRKVSLRGEKVAATKAYINGPARTFAEAGLKLVDKKVPDLDKADFDEPIVVDLVYEKEDGDRLLVQIRTFFTDVGHNVLVVADSQDNYDLLTKWAKSVEGKPPEKK